MMTLMRILTRKGCSPAVPRRARFAALLLSLLVGGAGAAPAAPEEQASAQFSGVHNDDTAHRARPAVLPFGSGDPHAVTESFLAQYEDAALSVQHLAILTLEPIHGSAGDTGTEEGIDEVRYHIKRKTRLSLRVHPHADQVGRIVLKNWHGTSVGPRPPAFFSGQGGISSRSTTRAQAPRKLRLVWCSYVRSPRCPPTALEVAWSRPSRQTKTA